MHGSLLDPTHGGLRHEDVQDLNLEAVVIRY